MDRTSDWNNCHELALASPHPIPRFRGWWILWVRTWLLRWPSFRWWTWPARADFGFGRAIRERNGCTSPTVRLFCGLRPTVDFHRLAVFVLHVVLGVSMTDPNQLIYRAIVLASSGQYLTIDEIKQQLTRENLSTEKIVGKKLIAQLSQLMARAQLTAAG